MFTLSGKTGLEWFGREWGLVHIVSGLEWFGREWGLVHTVR